MLANSEPKVGSRLRTLREQQGLSLRALVERCGLSINAISLIERGENSPTVSTLHRLATALNVSITDLFQDEVRQTVVLIKQGRGPCSQSYGSVMESLGVGLSNQQLEPFRMTINPGTGNFNDPIAHPGEEFIHCLQGEIDYSIGNQIYHLEKGDSLLFDATQQHAYRNLSQELAVILIVFQASHDSHRVQQLHLK